MVNANWFNYLNDLNEWKNGFGYPNYATIHKIENNFITD